MKPSGIYQAVLPLSEKIKQTVAFYNDYTYQLQEEYSNNKKDSIVLITGNWSPSDGFIWLYKDQVVRARYNWKEDTLQYYNPLSRKSISMHSMPDAMENKTWQNRKTQGTVFFGIGNEPFWSIENTRDSLYFQMSEWPAPMQMKLSNTITSSDSIAFTAQNDSSQLRVTVFPLFCNDGMSDFIYRNRIRVQYNNQVYNGCGVLFR